MIVDETDAEALLVLSDYLEEAGDVRGMRIARAKAWLVQCGTPLQASCCWYKASEAVPWQHKLDDLPDALYEKLKGYDERNVGVRNYTKYETQDDALADLGEALE